jgi:hypothetical protein
MRNNKTAVKRHDGFYGTRRPVSAITSRASVERRLHEDARTHAVSSRAVADIQPSRVRGGSSASGLATRARPAGSNGRFAVSPWPWCPVRDQRQRSERRFKFDHSFEPRNNKLMESAGSRPRLPSRWAGVDAKLPPAMDQFAGPAGGVVELPLDLAWSGDRRFDLADPVQRYLYHMTVLTSAVTREHYTRWLNASLLSGDWSTLRLPRPLREIWQAHFPELGPGQAADRA